MDKIIDAFYAEIGMTILRMDGYTKYIQWLKMVSHEQGPADYSAAEWEAFTEEWAHYCLKKIYVQVQRFGGAKDRGIDIAGFTDDQKLLGVWDNYQCKRYLDHAIYRSIQDVEARRLHIEKPIEDQKDATVPDGGLSTSVAEQFAQEVEAILKAWHYPGAERVFFDLKSRDLIIAGKARTARGKGLRAITHAAFTIGLLQFCKAKETPHPSFVILDTPLRAYREPEGVEDDLTGTDLNEKFYDYLASMTDDRNDAVIRALHEIQRCG
jgi:hypothetical protein